MAAATKTPFEKMMESATSFVKKQKGSWEHADWEAFLASASKLGIELNDENKRQIGNLLEAQKELFLAMPASAKKKAAAKKKAPVKKRATARR